MSNLMFKSIFKSTCKLLTVLYFSTGAVAYGGILFGDPGLDTLNLDAKVVAFDSNGETLSTSLYINRGISLTEAFRDIGERSAGFDTYSVQSLHIEFPLLHHRTISILKSEPAMFRISAVDSSGLGSEHLSQLKKVISDLKHRLKTLSEPSEFPILWSKIRNREDTLSVSFMAVPADCLKFVKILFDSLKGTDLDPGMKLELRQIKNPLVKITSLGTSENPTAIKELRRLSDFKLPIGENSRFQFTLWRDQEPLLKKRSKTYCMLKSRHVMNSIVVASGFEYQVLQVRLKPHSARDVSEFLAAYLKASFLLADKD